MWKVLLVILCLCSVGSADTFKFDHLKGHQDKHDHRCASPKATKRLIDFVNLDPKITIGHDQMTVTTKESTSAADQVIDATKLADKENSAIAADIAIVGAATYAVGSVGRWVLKDPVSGGQIIVLVDVLPFGWCTKATTCSPVPEMKLAIIQRYDGGECYESWHGDGEKP